MRIAPMELRVGNQQQQQPYQGYQGPPPQYNQNMVITTAPTVEHQTPVLTQSSAVIRCPNCQRNVIPNKNNEIGVLGWYLFILLCSLGCWLCAFIPFCMSSCKDVVYSCPNCKTVIYRQSQD